MVAPFPAVAAESLENKNFAITAYYNDQFYAVDINGVVAVDESNTGSNTTWANASIACSNAGKRLPSIEILKSINDNGAQGGGRGFTTSVYWSSTATTVASNQRYRQNTNDGFASREVITTLRSVRCVS